MKNPLAIPTVASWLFTGSVGALAADSGATLGIPEIDGPDVTVRWNSAGSLQVAPAVTGPWTTLSNQNTVTASSLTTGLEGPARFFRVVDNGVPGRPVPLLPESLSEPPAIDNAEVQLLSQPMAEGNSRLMIRFSPRSVPGNFSNSVPLLLDDRLTLLRDDGGGADQRSNDGIFTGVIPVNIPELDLANDHLNSLPPSRRFTQQFVNRRRVGQNMPLAGFPVESFLSGEVIPLVSTNVFGSLKFNCPAGSPLAYDWEKTLMIRHLTVVADPARTWDPCPAPMGTGTKMGAWTFGKLMTDMANPAVTGIDPSDFVRNWLRSWEFDQTINSDVVPSRSNVRTLIVNNWLAASAANGKPPGKLDLSIAPFRLLAIVNRVDLRSNSGLNYGGGNDANPCDHTCRGGEARFVFCAVSEACDPNPSVLADMLVILEYCVPKNTCREIKAWGTQWANLNAIPFGPAYNAALQAITDQFATANADPSRPPNRSAINQIRSNEILGQDWDLREWRISTSGFDAGHLREVTVANTPDLAHNNSAAINAFITSGLSEVPMLLNAPPFHGIPFLGGSAPMASPGFFWNGNPGLNGTVARHQFSLNTCNGCHSGETGTPFTHVACRGPSSTFQEAQLSDFLTGMNMPKPDPSDATKSNTFADLDRRVIDLDELVNCPCSPFHLVFTPPAIALQKPILMVH